MTKLQEKLDEIKARIAEANDKGCAYTELYPYTADTEIEFLLAIIEKQRKALSYYAEGGERARQTIAEIEEMV